MSFIELSWTRSSLLLLYHCCRIVIIIVIVIIIFFFCMTANVFDLMLVRLFGLFTVASFSFSRNVKFLSEIFTLTGWDTAHQACTTFISTIITSTDSYKNSHLALITQGVKGKLPTDRENHYVDQLMIKLQAKISELNFHFKAFRPAIKFHTNHGLS